MTSEELKEEFLRAALRKLDDGGWTVVPGSTNRILMEAVAEGLNSALKLYDDAPAISRARHWR